MAWKRQRWTYQQRHKGNRIVTKPLLAPRRDLPKDVTRLLTMLTYRRPSGGDTEAEFIGRFILPLGARPDSHDNYWLIIGESPILWSCHTDTVHKMEGIQRILYGDGFACTENSSCLGADCGVGVWLMSEMILAKVPGTYIFHANEEIGGLGSAAVAKHTPERLDGLKYAIAFDRKGTTEIITHQMSKRCASDAFAGSLADILKPLTYAASNGGTFTDTASYMTLIPECTNLGVGYYKQHTRGEHQDVYHALALRDAILAADWSKLVCERDPTVPVLSWWQQNNKKYYESATPAWNSEYDYGHGPSLPYEKESDMTLYVRRHAKEVAELLESLDITKEELDKIIHAPVA